MEDRAYETIRLLPRDELEAFAVRAAVHIGKSRRELESNRLFVAVLTAFVLGVLVASSGFLFGASLG